MTPGQFKVCTSCVLVYLNDLFSVNGSDGLAEGSAVPDDEVAELLRDGWTVTYHDHERTP